LLFFSTVIFVHVNIDGILLVKGSGNWKLAAPQ